MRPLAKYFLRGLVFVAPLAITGYVCWVVFTAVDRLLGFPVPGVGFLATIALITVIGFLASNFLARTLIGWIEGPLKRLPFVRILYSSTKDLLNAFVGEQRRFDRPVMVSLVPGTGPRAIGFVTQTSLDRLGLERWVAVYFPQSYNFAGNLLLYPADQVTPVDAETADVVAFVVSGGVTQVPARGPALPA
ncbi:MAG TPA: DUF502 domain-containing protein [Gemmatimonadaceae bacterium]|nr:DUF502 domain-containing protein [Gemmatimonadaceae bacterium]